MGSVELIAVTPVLRALAALVDEGPSNHPR
jgi:hypothetical protein